MHDITHTTPTGVGSRQQRSVLVDGAVAACLLAARIAAAQQAPDAISNPSASVGVEEITVTATRRSESAQNVPITIQALTGEALQQLNVQTFDDYVKYLPNVTYSGMGPGQNTVFMRGLSTTTASLIASGSVGSFPNVAIYLDDQSLQLPGRNADLYTADLERVEVLEGPQGTLYGAGAQAGAIRYISNKPKINKTEVSFTAGYSATAHGDPSSMFQGMLNLPLIANRLALRLVFYTDAQGGYIRNVPGTFARQNTDLGIIQYFGGVVPPGSTVINNTNLVKRAINPVTYKGARASALYEINDDWSLLVQQSYQQMEADGVFGEDPSLGDLAVQQFNQSSDNDRVSQTSWTLEGRLGALKAVYTGGYLARNVEAISDYTGYTRGVYADYYQCRLPTATSSGICYSPSATWKDDQRNAHQSHELRLSTPDEWRLRAIGGLFWEDYKIQDAGSWDYGDPQAGFTAQLPPAAGSTMFDPSPRPLGVVFFDDVTRGYTQKAAFFSFDFDLVPHRLTLTAGTRYYDMDTFEKGSKNTAYGCRDQNPCTPPYSVNLDTLKLSDGTVGLRKSFVGFKSRYNLSWKVTDNALLYATWSQGFRPGGFNRGQGQITSHSPLFGEFTVPYFFAPDVLTNKEIGWKTSWFDRRLQFNGAVYQEDWKNVQMSVFNPGLYGNLSFAMNGPNYRVRGVEGEVNWRVTEHLSLISSFAWNSGEQVNNPTLIGANGQPVALFPTGGPGSPLAQSPPFQGNIRARYELPLGTYDAFFQIGAQHSAHSYASVDTETKDLTGKSVNYDQAPYTTYDASLGVHKDAWSLELFGRNLTDERAQLYKNFKDWLVLTTVSRPRVIGVNASYKF